MILVFASGSCEAEIKVADIGLFIVRHIHCVQIKNIHTFLFLSVWIMFRFLHNF